MKVSHPQANCGQQKLNMGYVGKLFGNSVYDFKLLQIKLLWNENFTKTLIQVHLLKVTIHSTSLCNRAIRNILNSKCILNYWATIKQLTYSDIKSLEVSHSERVLEPKTHSKFIKDHENDIPILEDKSSPISPNRCLQWNTRCRHQHSGWALWSELIALSMKQHRYLLINQDLWMVFALTELIQVSRTDLSWT